MAGLFRLVSILAVLGGVSLMTGVASAQQGIMLDVDAPTAGVNVMDGQPLLIGGWAHMPGGAISSVDVYLDAEGGNPVGTARLGIVRRDVAAVLGRPEALTSGYNVDWIPRNLSQGSHTLYVVARSTTGQTITQAVPISACGCGLRGSITNPVVVSVGPYGYELDTGGPGVWLERPNDMPPNDQ